MDAPGLRAMGKGVEGTRPEYPAALWFTAQGTEQLVSRPGLEVCQTEAGPSHHFGGE